MNLSGPRAEGGSDKLRENQTQGSMDASVYRMRDIAASFR
jgi:hypothetical protein